MVDRPILFNGAMVRAILAGRKSQTRRALRDQNPVDLGAAKHGAHLRRQPRFDKVAQRVVGTSLVDVRCPFGQPGDRLWVRETFGYRAQFFERDAAAGGPVVYRADGEDQPALRGMHGDHWRPSIHMPRSACRLVLEVTDVRVERLHAITEGDAEAEGTTPIELDREDDCGNGWTEYWYRGGFEKLWNSTGGDWAANPWVWVVGFRVAEGQSNG